MFSFFSLFSLVYFWCENYGFCMSFPVFFLFFPILPSVFAIFWSENYGFCISLPVFSCVFPILPSVFAIFWCENYGFCISLPVFSYFFLFCLMFLLFSGLILFVPIFFLFLEPICLLFFYYFRDTDSYFSATRILFFFWIPILDSYFFPIFSYLINFNLSQPFHCIPVLSIGWKKLD